MKIPHSFIRSLLIVIALGCFALCPMADAVTPPPDGGYPGQNTAEGDDALFSLTTGIHNTANGWQTLYFNTVGNYNTATGSNALYSNITGSRNTANGVNALLDNTYGSDNTAIGWDALLHNTGDRFFIAGDGNVAVGTNALASNTTGNFNTAVGLNALANSTNGHLGGGTAIGAGALQSNTEGDANTATGVLALSDNITGDGNTAMGDEALAFNTIGDENTASGLLALGNNMSGNSNTADGVEALRLNTIGSYNTATGKGALYNNGASRNTATGYQALVLNTTGHDNTAIGLLALGNNTTGSYNTAIGQTALFNNTTGGSNIALDGGGLLTTGNNNIDIGNLGVVGESDTIRIGTQGGGRTGGQTATYIAGINGAGVMGVPVKVNAAGQLGTAPSSARFKEEIQSMGKASETILALKPVRFRYKKVIDPERTVQFGLVAEDVQKVSPDLVERDREGKLYTVRYDAVNAMLLNEFLKEHKKVEEQQATIADLKSTVAQQQQTFQSRLAEQDKQIEALASGLQKVSARLDVNERAPQMVSNR